MALVNRGVNTACTPFNEVVGLRIRVCETEIARATGSSAAGANAGEEVASSAVTRGGVGETVKEDVDYIWRED